MTCGFFNLSKLPNTYLRFLILPSVFPFGRLRITYVSKGCGKGGAPVEVEVLSLFGPRCSLDTSCLGIGIADVLLALGDGSSLGLFLLVSRIVAGAASAIITSNIGRTWAMDCRMWAKGSVIAGWWSVAWVMFF